MMERNRQYDSDPQPRQVMNEESSPEPPPKGAPLGPLGGGAALGEPFRVI